MAGNMTGGKKAAATNKAKYDAEYLRKYGMTYYQYWGSVGGKRGTTGGFWADRELAREAGRKGGRISRPRKTSIVPDIDFMFIWNESDTVDEVYETLLNAGLKITRHSMLNRASLLRQAGYDLKFFKRKPNHEQSR